MIIVYVGTDTEKLRIALRKNLQKTGAPLRITDAHSVEDLAAALRGGGMFGPAQPVVLENVLSNADLREIVLPRLEEIAAREETIHIIESAPDAATKKLLEKHAKSVVRFDIKKEKPHETIFGLANALQGGTKKDLWIGIMRELAAGKSAEAIHGVLFWAGKQHLLRKPSDARARRLVAELAELPHAARRAGEELDYALERFALSRV